MSPEKCGLQHYDILHVHAAHWQTILPTYLTVIQKILNNEQAFQSLRLNQLSCSRLCSMNCTYWLGVRQEALPALWEAPLGVKSCYHVIAVHREWAWVRRTRQKGNHSWVCLSLWTSAGCVGIKRNQSLCKLDQWEANNISAPVPLLQTVFLCGGPQTFCRLLPVNNRKYLWKVLLGVTAMFVALVFGSVLTIHHQKSWMDLHWPLICLSLIESQYLGHHWCCSHVLFNFSAVLKMALIGHKSASSHSVVTLLSSSHGA